MTTDTGNPRSLHLTWVALILATLFGVGTAEFFGHRLFAVAAVMIVAGTKVFLILRNFMELKDGPLGFRIFFGAWTLACVGSICALYAIAAGT